MKNIGMKFKSLTFYKKKPLYIVLTALFSLLLCADLVIGIALPVQTTMGGMDGMSTVGGRADMSDMGDMADRDDTDLTDIMGGEEMTAESATGEEIPSESFSADGEMPSMGREGATDGEMPDTSGSAEFDASDFDASDFDGAAFDTSDFDMSSTAAGGSGVMSFLQGVKSHWVLLAVIFGVLDAASIVMLVFLSRREKKLRLQKAKEAAEAAAAAGEVVHPIQKKPVKKHHQHSGATWAVVLVGMILLVVVVEGVSRFNTGTTTSETEASIISGEAEVTTLSTTLPGAGTLAEEDSEDLTVPDGVEISQWYVSDGDAVAEGDVLAAVDKVSVLSAVENIQTLLDALDEELAEHEDDEISDELTATASGRVKVIYAAEDTAVVDTMYESGALMLISLDGTMAVSLETEAELSAGDTVVVTLSDGTEVDGKVESYLNGTAVVTLSNDGPAYGEEVTVTTSDGDTVGTGTLYIHSELKVTGYAGAVESVDVAVDDEVEAGDTLLTLTDTEYTGDYETLLAQREALETQMNTLFQLYQDGYLYASCSGVVSGIDEDSATATVSTGTTASVSLLTNEPEETGEEDYLDFLCLVTAVDEENQVLTLSITAEPVEIEDYADLSSLDLTEEALAEILTETATLDISESVLVYTYTDEAWVSSGMSELKAGDILLLTCNRTNEEDIPVWIVYAGSTEADEEPEEPGNAETEQPSETENAQNGEAGTETAGGTSTGDSSALTGTTGSAGTDATGGTAAAEDAVAATDETATEEESSTSYGVSETTLLSITPQDSMTITITVDELDILSLAVGQEAQVTLDALPGQSFDGVVTAIDTSGSNSGGSSKYSVEVTIDRNESMLVGMNASVKITISTTEDVLTIPEAALVEEDSIVYVYTSYDEETDTLGDPVEVTTGLSDGENVEILSGLSEGDEYWYSYLDTVNYSVASVGSSSSSFSFSFGGMGGGM